MFYLFIIYPIFLLLWNAIIESLLIWLTFKKKVPCHWMFPLQHILRNQSAKLPRRSPFLVHLHCSLHFHPHASVRPSSSTHSQLPGPRIAIIGSGPSGLYVCARLLQKLPQCRIDVFDKAQAPFGLIYYGANQRLQLFGNVDVNRDLSYAELCNAYEAVVLAYGASKARRLGLTNENAGNSLSGKDFVSWYNGAPFFCAPPKLDQGSEAIVIGNGNVAIDCSRMLLSPSQRLAQTDITESALRALRNSRIRNVRILGRRGPKEISFTIKELRELLNLDERMHSFCEIDAEQLKADLDGMERPKKRLMELMLGYAVMDRREKLKEILAANQKNLKTLQLQFHRRPVAIETEGGNVCALRVQNTLSGHEELFPCNLLIYAVGFEHLLLDGVPRTENGQLAMTDWCRVPEKKAAVYATGWCSHAARGLIAESQQQAYSVADQIVDDWEGRRIPIKTSIAEGGEMREQIAQMLQSRNVHYINWDDWRHLDKCERRMGAILGKTREKITDFTTMLRIMRQNGI